MKVFITWSGPADECSNDDHCDPQNDKAKHEGRNGKLALLPRVIPAAQRIRVYIWNHHQSNDDHRRHYHAGNPWVEIDEHLLQTEEIPRSLCRVHRQVGIGRFLERSEEHTSELQSL